MKLAVFFHCRLSGDVGRYVQACAAQPNQVVSPSAHEVNRIWAASVAREQVQAMKESGLVSATDHFILGLNGPYSDIERAKLALPDNVQVHCHGIDAMGLAPTMRLMAQFALEHPGWFCCFLHIKGVLHPGDVFYQDWRRCMERAIVWNWNRCVTDLEAGYDTVGAHWLQNQPQDIAKWGPGHFWGGVFYWARADYLSRLPELPEQIRTGSDWYNPEHWVGSGPVPARAMDYRPHWPNPKLCEEGAV